MNHAKFKQVVLYPELRKSKTQPCYIAGVVITENDRILPLLSDGEFRFEPFDPVKQEFVDFWQRTFEQKQPSNKLNSNPDPDFDKRREALARCGATMIYDPDDINQYILMRQDKEGTPTGCVIKRSEGSNHEQ